MDRLSDSSQAAPRQFWWLESLGYLFTSPGMKGSLLPRCLWMFMGSTVSIKDSSQQRRPCSQQGRGVLTSFYYQGVKLSNGTFIFLLWSKRGKLKNQNDQFEISKQLGSETTVIFSMWGMLSSGWRDYLDRIIYKSQFTHQKGSVSRKTTWYVFKLWRWTFLFITN